MTKVNCSLKSFKLLILCAIIILPNEIYAQTIRDKMETHVYKTSHLMEWFYSGLGGIYQADNSIGYNNIIIAPKPVGNITWSKCSYHSPKGVIISEWELVENAFSLTIEVPLTSSAEIILPDDYQNSTVEVINLIDEKPVDIEFNEGAYTLKSGKYIIIASL